MRNLAHREAIAFEWLEKGEVFLDVGCGKGRLCIAAKQKYKKIYGCDISDELVIDLKRKDIYACKLDLNTQKLPFSNDYFDGITCLDVIEHVVDPHFLLEEIKRVLKNNGIFIISTPNIGYLKHRLRAIIGKSPKTSGVKTQDKLAKKYWDGGHLHYFTFSDMRQLLSKHKFRIIGEKGIFSRGLLNGNFLFKELLAAGMIFKCKKEGERTFIK